MSKPKTIEDGTPICFSAGLLFASDFGRPVLPDTLHELPREERFAYAKLLAYIMRIDDEVTIDEMAVFEQRLGTALLSPRQRREIRSYLNQPPSLDECLADLGEVSGRLALRDAAMMSSADGVIDEEEQIVLESIAKHIGVDDGVVDDLLDWVMRGYDWMQEGLDLLNVD